MGKRAGKVCTVVEDVSNTGTFRTGQPGAHECAALFQRGVDDHRTAGDQDDDDRLAAIRAFVDEFRIGAVGQIDGHLLIFVKVALRTIGIASGHVDARLLRPSLASEWPYFYKKTSDDLSEAYSF